MKQIFGNRIRSGVNRPESTGIARFRKVPGRQVWEPLGKEKKNNKNISKFPLVEVVKDDRSTSSKRPKKFNEINQN